MKRLAPLVLTASLITISGCGAIEKAHLALTTPGPSGLSPLDEAVEAVPRVLTNPYDIPAWVAIVSAATVAIGGAVAGKAHEKRKNGKTPPVPTETQ
jgi:hypothetical protein